jgi:hypothetical protein
MMEEKYCLIYRDPNEKMPFNDQGTGELPIKVYHWDNGTIFFPKDAADEILNKLESKGFNVRVGRQCKTKTVSHREIVEADR